MWANFNIQSTLNYGPHFWKLQKAERFSKLLAMQMKRLGQVWGLGEMICKWNNSPNKLLEPNLENLKSNQIGSNPNANLNHHMKSHDQAPCEVTSPTDKAKLHDVT